MRTISTELTTKAVIFFFLFFIFTSNNFIIPGNEKNGLNKIVEAEKLFRSYKYQEAVDKFLEAERLLKKQINLSRLYLGLSKSYYALGLLEKTREIINKFSGLSIQIKFNEEDLPRGFTKILNEILSKSKGKTVIEKPGIKKKKKKFPLLIVMTGLAAVIAAIVLLGKKKSTTDNNTINPPTDPEPTEDQIANAIYTSIEWVNIPSGEFQMGDNFVEGGLDERTVHSVYLDSYYISKYEFTFELYDKYCDVTGRSRPDDEGWGRETRPVINISWTEAKAFCDWLSEKTGKNIHLPTEAQWERAARGTDQRRYPWGNSDASCNKCNHNNCIGQTMPVGSYSAGANGIYDMAGNVWEFCSDWYSSSYYSESPYSNPQGPSTGSTRVVRGGCWGCGETYSRSASRESSYVSTINSAHGFRICETK